MRALAGRSLARRGCILRPRRQGAFFRRLVPVHLGARHPLARSAGSDLVHLLVDARPEGPALRVRVVAAIGDRSLAGVRARRIDAPRLDATARAALRTRLARVLGLAPGAPFERLPSIWEALVTALLGGRVAGARGPGGRVVLRRNVLARTFGTVARDGDGELGVLPDPAGLARTTARALEAAGVPPEPARHLCRVARRVASGRLSLSALFGARPETVLETLRTIDGLSPSARKFVATHGVGFVLDTRRGRR